MKDKENIRFRASIGDAVLKSPQAGRMILKRTGTGEVQWHEVPCPRWRVRQEHGDSELTEPDETPNKDGTKLAPKGKCPSRHGGPR